MVLYKSDLLGIDFLVNHTIKEIKLISMIMKELFPLDVPINLGKLLFEGSRERRATGLPFRKHSIHLRGTLKTVIMILKISHADARLPRHLDKRLDRIARPMVILLLLLDIAGNIGDRARGNRFDEDVTTLPSSLNDRTSELIRGQ